MNSRFNSFELVVAGVIAHQEWVDSMRAALDAEDFLNPTLNEIVTVIYKLAKSDAQINHEVVSAQIDEDYVDYVFDLYLSGEELELNSWKSLLKHTTEQVARRIISEESEKLAFKSEDQDVDVHKLLSKLTTLKEKAEQRINGSDSESAMQYGDALRLAVEKMHDRATQENYGISTGLRALDNQILGLQGGDLIIVGARPSMGKTAFSMGLVESSAIQGHKAMIFSVEMSSDDLALRTLASQGSIDFQNLRQGKLSELEKARLSEATERIRSMPIVVDDRGGLTISQLEVSAMQEHKKGPLGLIMIDYLQLMSLHDLNEENASRKIGEISRRLKLLAKQLQVPIVLLSQLNRSLEQRPNKRPVKSDLRDSGNVEQDADIIMFLYRDEVYNEDSADKGTAEIIVDKQRNGPIGTVRARFVGKYTRFEDLQLDDDE